MTTVVVPGIVVAGVVLAALGAAGRVRAHRRPVGPDEAELAPPRSTRSWRTGYRRRRTPPSPRAVADWCDDLARALRAGASVRHAVSHTTPGDPQLAGTTDVLRRAAQHGEPLAEATRRCPSPGPHLQVALVVIATIADVGGAAAMALDRTAGAMRQRAADADDRGVHAAQARLSGHVLTALPLGMLAVLTVTDADVRGVIASPAGSASIVVGLALNALGWWWITRLTRVPT